MDETLIKYVQDMRNRLLVLKGLVHFHMSSDKRFIAEAELLRASDDLEIIYSFCTGCKPADRNSQGS